MNLKLLALQIATMFLVFALVMFLAAGTIAWFPGWIFLALFFGFVISVSAWLIRNNPELLQERMTGTFSSQQEACDKLFISIAGLLFVFWLILMPLDAARYHWSRMPVWIEIAGAIIFIGSLYLFFLTFRENSYLSPVIRIQEERGQTVVSTGPYHYVRHPMYAAFVLFVVGTPLLFGSWFGLLWGVLMIIAVAIRAVREEKVLRKDLPGYDEYMSRVKYRLIPYVW